MAKNHHVSIAREVDGFYWVRCTCSSLSIGGPSTGRTEAGAIKRIHLAKFNRPGPEEPEVSFWSKWDVPGCSYCGYDGHIRETCPRWPVQV